MDYFIKEDIIVGFIFNFLRDVFDLNEIAMDVCKGVAFRCSAPSCGESIA